MEQHGFKGCQSKESLSSGKDEGGLDLNDLDDVASPSIPYFDITSAGKHDHDLSEPFSGGVSEATNDLDTSHNDEFEKESTVVRFSRKKSQELGDYDGNGLLGTKLDTIQSISSQISDFSDVPSSNPKALTPYNRFLERLKHPSCMETIRAVKGLIAMLPGKMSRSEAAAVVHNFIDIYTPKLLALDAFSELPEDERNISAEFFEKFTMQKLYSQCYSMDANDRIEDEMLWIKMRCLQWVEPKHLEISSEVDESILKEAQVQLNNISKFKAPRDKLVGILNCCRLVVHSLEDNSDKLVSADEALPLLIYVTIRANPYELWSSIEYIQHFRHPSRHIAEEAYGFTLLVSAVEYIRSIGHTTHLKMDENEFNRIFNEAQEPYMSRLVKLAEAQQTKNDESKTTISTIQANSSVLNRLKKMAQPALMFKSMIVKNLASEEINEAIESLSTLEAYIMDMPLVFNPENDYTTDSPALLSDWRALIAMRELALVTVTNVKQMLSNVTQ
ncbi:vacuolar protein sorting-associated protein 9 like protein [Babesia gibsoni]|uniref:Vacuolar protein sorting-associated protein 9 like protein n=1 Tax=Babesia gibsoni TaxID=33632 RepID=A0AAD8UQL8_BABGI|nr:vacuolar protein sorting-associated protein 9 like protein [Babesia gibsoni]